MENEVQEAVSRLQRCFPKSWMNYDNELIADRMANRQYGGACCRLRGCETAEDVTCAAIESFAYDCSKSRPFKTPGANVDFRTYMSKGLNAFLGADLTEQDYAQIFTKLGCGINRRLTREFVRAGCDMEVLRRYKVEKVISADQLLETLNGLEYRARTLEQSRGGNDVLRNLLPKVIAKQKSLRTMQIVTCERCQSWSPENGRCSITGRKKRKDGFCDEGREKEQNPKQNEN